MGGISYVFKKYLRKPLKEIGKKMVMAAFKVGEEEVREKIPYLVAFQWKQDKDAGKYWEAKAKEYEARWMEAQAELDKRDAEIEGSPEPEFETWEF